MTRADRGRADRRFRRPALWLGLALILGGAWQLGAGGWLFLAGIAVLGLLEQRLDDDDAAAGPTAPRALRPRLGHD